MDEFKALIEFHKHPHILSIAETWFNQESARQINGYNLFYSDREMIRGGGVAIYVRSYITALETTDPILTDIKTEHVWCSVKIGSDSILVGCIYRPPSSNADTNEAINNIIKRAHSLVQSGKFDGMMISGDFNFSDMTWDLQGANFKSPSGFSPSREFKGTLDDSFLHQFVHGPTFGQNYLDLVLSNDLDRIANVEIDPPLGTSTKNCLHNCVRWDFYLRPPNTNPNINAAEQKSYAKGNYDELRSFFTYRDWNFDHQEQISNWFCKFKDCYNEASKLFIPNKGSNGKFNYERLIKSNKLLKDALKEKFRTFAIKKASRSDSSATNLFNKACKNVKHCVKKIRKELETEMLSKFKSNPKLLYSYINSQKKCKQSIKALKLPSSATLGLRMLSVRSMN